jgi:CBS domain-containing protein
MICPYCSTENIEGADQCSNCGQSLYGLDLPEAGKYPTAPFMDQPLGRIPQRDAVKAQTTDPVAFAIRRMKQENTGAILIMEGERLVGIITGTDILLKVAGPKEDLNAITCGQIMTPDPVVFHYDDSIALALNKMSIGEYRHIPIVRNDRPVSVIDVNDVFRFITPNLV